MAATLINIIRIIIIPLIHFGTKFGSWEVVLTRTNDFHLFDVGCGGGEIKPQSVESRTQFRGF